MSKDTYWFRHDSNARNDVRLVKLRRVSGLEGVGLFWCVIEMLRESKNYELPLSAIADIAFDLRVEEKVFDALFECELLTKGDTFFFSNSLLHRMNEYDKVKEKRRQAGSKGGIAKASAKNNVANASKSVASAKQSSSKSVAKPKQSLANRVELIRVEENRVDKKGIEDYNTPNPSKGDNVFDEFSPIIKIACSNYKFHLSQLGKGYKKTDKAWDLFKGKVAKMIVAHGEHVTLEQINSAIEGNWKTIYEPKENRRTSEIKDRF